MSRASARFMLRMKLARICEQAADGFDVPDIQDGIRLLVATEGGSEELLEALAGQAGLELRDPLEDVFLDADEPS